MSGSLVHNEIDRLMESLEGELTSHSRVIDGLLDLRTATDDHRLQALVDDTLANLPGRNTVETAWWELQLTTFRLFVELAPDNDGELTAA